MPTYASKPHNASNLIWIRFRDHKLDASNFTPQMTAPTLHEASTHTALDMNDEHVPACETHALSVEIWLKTRLKQIGLQLGDCAT